MAAKRPSLPVMPPDKNMKILTVNKEALKSEASGLYIVINAIKQKGKYDKTFSNKNKGINTDILRKQFSLLSNNLPRAFDAIIEHNTDFKINILLQMIDKIYAIGNDPHVNISEIKIDIAQMLSDAFLPSDNENKK